MRLKSEVWVKAYIRRCASAGLMAAVVRHGDDDAGAIYIRINRLDGTSLLFGPSPAGLDGAEEERRWIACFKEAASADAAVDAYLERQGGFDSDLWVVEVESRDGAHLLEGWLT
jgi:hypothetical protein